MSSDLRIVTLHGAPQESPPTVVPLSPYDRCNKGRATPMVWFYEQDFEIDKLVSSLQTVLTDYPVLCGRYSVPPTAIVLNNSGVPVRVKTIDMKLSEAIAHLPIPSNAMAEPCFFSRTAHEAFLPPKTEMDPDSGSPEAPLLSVQLSIFSSGGTAIGLLVQHGVLDADAQINLVRNWSLVHRGLPMDPMPVHERRCLVDSEAPHGGSKKPDRFNMKVVPEGVKAMPEFAPVMGQIMGDTAVLVPFSADALARLKTAALACLPRGEFVSTDDLLTAHIWRALAVVRLHQGLAAADKVSTLIRACNFRGRIGLPPGYCANGVCQVWSELAVGDLVSMPPIETARKLRAALAAHTEADVQQRTKWLVAQHKAGFETKLQFDADALSFIVSSWGFPWWEANFGGSTGVPVAFDHGAHVPIVSVIIPRKPGEGAVVYHSGTRSAVEAFAAALHGAAHAAP